jgi:hypothetical protein
MPMELKEIRLASRYDHDGRLVLIDGSLIAVLVKLSDVHAELSGHWFLETGYGVVRNKQPTFKDLKAAVDWIDSEVSRSDSSEWI